MVDSLCFSLAQLIWQICSFEGPFCEVVVFGILVYPPNYARVLFKKKKRQGYFIAGITRGIKNLVDGDGYRTVTEAFG
jgi:hypothetical protein